MKREKSGYFDSTVRPEELAKAMKYQTRELDKDYEEFKNLAETVMNFFGFGERIIDNVLDSEERDIFYMFEDAGILKTEREEVSLWNGKNWRINYWVLNKDKIYESVDKFEEDKQKKEEMEEVNVFGDMDDSELSSIIKNHTKKENTRYEKAGLSYKI